MNRQPTTIDMAPFEALVAAWLESEAAGELPDRILSATFEVTAREPQRRGLRHRLARLASVAARWPGASERWGPGLASALRVAVVVVLLVVIGIGAVLTIRNRSAPAPGIAPATTSPAAQAAELFSVTLDGQAIPEDLAGVLFFRKIYATADEITYGDGFVPPNTFARYVESGELGIRPRAPVHIIRAGATWAEAETVDAGEEAVVGAGDTFVMQDIPWDQYGSEALGEMWTPGDDARVVGFAIRETSRCCAMTHAGMRSPWYHTLLEGVAELRGAPVELRISRWDVPVGAELPPVDEGLLVLRAVDVGVITGTVQGESAAPSASGPRILTFGQGGTIQPPATLEEGQSVRFGNAGPEAAVVYELEVERGEPREMTPAATTVTVTATGPMLNGRSGHSATLLHDERVLITGGGSAQAEVYDPGSGTFGPAGEMASERDASATLLEDGRVLLSGGGALEAEVFDPDTSTVVPAGRMTELRRFQAATRLFDGRVLITGGETATAELFDPGTGSFAATGTMATSRSGHVSVHLGQGRVLVTGGCSTSAELFDPATGTFARSKAEGMRPIGRGTATYLTDGRVLLIGPDTTPQLYDPTADAVTTTGPMARPRSEHAAVLLNDGRVLVIGGLDDKTLRATASIEIFDPRTATFEEVGSLGVARQQPTATRLCDDRILVTGGSGATFGLASAELLEIRAGA